MSLVADLCAADKTEIDRGPGPGEVSRHALELGGELGRPVGLTKTEGGKGAGKTVKGLGTLGSLDSAGHKGVKAGQSEGLDGSRGFLESGGDGSGETREFSSDEGGCCTRHGGGDGLGGGGG